MNREINFKLAYQDSRTGEYYISQPYSLNELINGIPDDFLEDLSECSCTCVGESNLIACEGQCDEWIDHLELKLKIQATGLKDKEGKEIYEGDVLKHNSLDWKVVWSEETARWKLYSSKEVNCVGNHFYNYLNRGNSAESEIVGNVFENPELLNH